MNLENSIFMNKKNYYFFLILVIFSFCVRVPVILKFGDVSLDNEWGIILKNYINFEKFSLRQFDGFYIPNIQMPPLYAFYLYLIYIIQASGDLLYQESSFYINLVLFSQAILASISVAVFFIICKKFFSEKISIFCALIFSIFPAHVFACSQISSVSLQLFLTILFIYNFLKISKNPNFLNIFYFSVISALLLLLRGEFLILFFISILYLFFIFKLNIKKNILILFLAFLVVSPYVIRNVVIFDTITITKSFGYNLWRGNNPDAVVEGIHCCDDNPILAEELIKISKDKFYEINMDNFFLKETISYLKEDPVKYFNLYLKKLISFILIDINSSNKNYFNLLNVIPFILFGITSTIGLLLSLKKNSSYKFLIIYYLINVSVISMFFILPRYKIAILPLQIIFTAALIEKIIPFFKKN